MKRVITSMLLIITFTLTLVFVSAQEGKTGNLVVHYQNTTGDYSDVGLNSWGHEDETMGGTKSPEDLKDIVKEDGFGVYWELNNISLSDDDNDSIGFQVVGFDDGEPNWDNKKYANHEISKSILVEGETVHVYMFYGSNTRTNDEGLDEPIPYLYTNPGKHNLLLVYFDQSNAYDENLGLHGWGWTNIDLAEGWGTPNKVLENVGTDLTGTPIKAVMLQYDYDVDGENNYGFLIYAGGDNNKKTGDVKIDELFTDEQPMGLGKADVLQVYEDGDGNTSNENLILNDGEEFIKQAYSFNLVPMFDDEGEYKGTFAPNPNQIIVELNSSVMAPVKLDEDGEKLEITDEEKTVEVKKWFTVKSEDNNEVEIDDVHFDAGASSLRSFVIILADNLDNTKDYTLYFDLGLEDDENKKADILVNMDTEAPKIQFISPSSFANETDPDKRIIEVPWNKKFDQNLFPRFVVTDDRDGDITRLVYVPKGDFSILNTNVLGDYKIMLRVEDSWGNVTEETFIFRVVKK